MRVEVRVTPRARRAGVELLPDGTLAVKVTAPAEGGRANEAVVELLAAHFRVPKRSVAILRGRTARRKLVEIL